MSCTIMSIIYIYIYIEREREREREREYSTRNKLYKLYIY